MIAEANTDTPRKSYNVRMKNARKVENMAKGNALKGKPDVVNPHVRFDGGNVAPTATPRRRFLLYTKNAMFLSIISLAWFTAGAIESDRLYMVVNISGGTQVDSYPISYLSAVPQTGWSDEFKTSKIVLRKIEPGSFTMGCATNEVGYMKYLQEDPYSFDAVRHEVKLSKEYYVGVFEITQRQWESVMGTRPSWFSVESDYATRPVENISYQDIRGVTSIPLASVITNVSANSFMGVLRKKTGIRFDLPTEAQWEYACRAGKSTALNNGRNLSSMVTDVSASAVARYRGNSGYAGRISRDWGLAKGTAAVGSYAPNDWGLYDMHGNVREWCLDAFSMLTVSTSVEDPVTLTNSGWSGFVVRGGGWSDYAHALRSANRHDFAKADSSSVFCGFRLACAVTTDGTFLKISYVYDDDDRLKSIVYGDSAGGIDMELTPAGNTKKIDGWRAE